jgi:hypothetical protein
VALRFLRYFPYLPKGLKITQKALSITSAQHIGKSFAEIAAFVWRDLANPPPFGEPTDVETKKFLDVVEEKRTKVISKIFKHYPN